MGARRQRIRFAIPCLAARKLLANTRFPEQNQTVTKINPYPDLAIGYMEREGNPSWKELKELCRRGALSIHPQDEYSGLLHRKCFIIIFTLLPDLRFSYINIVRNWTPKCSKSYSKCRGILISPKYTRNIPVITKTIKGFEH